MPNIEHLLGQVVINGQGQEVPVSELRSPGKIVGLYFSAQWCPPCRSFTEHLIAFYQHFQGNADTKNSLDIVFVSSDKDEASFGEYFKEMPWYALPYVERERKVNI